MEASESVGLHTFVCAYSCMYLYSTMYIGVYTFIRLCIFVYVCTLVNIHSFLYIRAYTFVCICFASVRFLCMCSPVYSVYTHVYMFVYSVASFYALGVPITVILWYFELRLFIALSLSKKIFMILFESESSTYIKL
jgi:hypothetical protein